MSMTKGLVMGASLALLSIGVAGTAAAADGAALYTGKACMTCHGAEGKAPIAPNYPKLAGQNATYLSQQIKDIKSGARSNSMSSVMKPMVAAVSDEEIDAIAEYLSGL